MINYNILGIMMKTYSQNQRILVTLFAHNNLIGIIIFTLQVKRMKFSTGDFLRVITLVNGRKITIIVLIE